MACLKPLNVIIFASVSTPAQATDDKDSLPSQVRDGQAWTASVGGDVIATYRVPGHSRKYIFYHDAEREMIAYRRLRDDCTARTFDVLWCRARDRLGRTDALIAQVEALVTNAGAEIYSAAMPHPIGQASEGSHLVLSAVERGMAELENIQRVRRWEIGIKARIRRGLPHSRWPYGYRPIRDDLGRTIGGEIVAEEVGAIHLATRLFLEGMGTPLITRELNESGWRPRESVRWGRTSVRRLLSNDFYAAHVVYRGEHYQSDKFPPIWDKATHEAVVRERARRYRGGKPPSTCISGIAICNRCGRAMIAARLPGRSLRYRCPTRALEYAYPDVTCHPNSIVVQKLVAALREALLAVRSEEDAWHILNASSPGRTPLERELATAKEGIQSVQAKRRRLAITLAEGNMAGDIYHATDDRYVDELSALVRQAQEIEQRLAVMPAPEEYVGKFLALVEQIHEDPDWLMTQPVEKARTALLDIGAAIYVEAGEIVNVAFGVTRGSGTSV